MAEVAKLLRAALGPICSHGISNAGLEAVNAVLQWLKKTARGFHHPEHLKIAISLHCGP